MGPKTRVTKRRGKTFYLYRDSTSNPSAVQPTASRYTDFGILAPVTYLNRLEVGRIGRSGHRLEPKLFGW
jgi:hypothetical protein